MVIKYHLSPYPALTQNLIVKIWEAQNDNPGAEVYEEEIPEKDGAGVPTPGAGHQVINTVVADGLDFIVHRVRLYAKDSGALLHFYEAEATQDVVTIFDPIFFKIGDGGEFTPAAGSREYVNPVLAGLGDLDYLINRNNYGILFPNIHYETDGANDKFVLLDPNDQFNENEEFVIIRKTSHVSSVVNDSVVGKWFGGFVDVAADTSYSSTHLRKLIRFSGSCEYTFEADDNIPIGYAFVFQHYGVEGTCKVNFLNADLLWAGSDKTEIDIPSYSEAAFVFDGSKWNVVYLCDSSWMNEADDPVAGDILGTGKENIGDVPAGDNLYTITHNKGIVGDYNVMGSIFNNDSGTHFRNNKMGWSWHHHPTDKPNKFIISVQELAGEVQTLSFAWLLIKA